MLQTDSMTSTTSSANPKKSVITEIEPREAYEKRLEEVTAQIGDLSRRDLRFVRIRTGIFLAALLLGILCIGESDHIS